MDIEDIWKPDIEVYNVVEMTGLRKKEQVVLNYNGDVLWIPPYKMTTTCPMYKQWFPFDDRDCEITIGSWSYDSRNIDLQLREDNADLSSYITNNDWDLIGMPGTRNEMYYGPYLDIRYEVKLRRRTLPYIHNIIIPASLITLLAILSLLIPASSPSPRTLLIIFSFFIICILGQGIPHNSLLASMIGCSLTTIFLLFFHSVLTIAIATTRYCNFPNLGFIKRFLLCNCFQNKGEASSEEQLYFLSRCLDYTALGIYLLGFIITFIFKILSAPHIVVQ